MQRREHLHCKQSISGKELFLYLWKTFQTKRRSNQTLPFLRSVKLVTNPVGLCLSRYLLLWVAFKVQGVCECVRACVCCTSASVHVQC